MKRPNKKAKTTKKVSLRTKRTVAIPAHHPQKKIEAVQTGVHPGRYPVTISMEQHDGEWFYRARVAELPDATVYEQTAALAYKAMMITIASLHEAAIEENRVFPAPGELPHPPPVAKLRQALEFYDKACASPDGREVGAVKDGHQWVFEAARAIAGVYDHACEATPNR